MSTVETTSSPILRRWSNDGLTNGVVDLYARRMAAVSAVREDARQEALDRIVTTQPFGRAFTAQPSFPPDPPEAQGAIAGLRRKLAGTAPERPRKLATS